MARALIVIPARYGSTRFLGKPLALIAGKTMIQRVYEQCSLVNNCNVIVATDDESILNHVLSFGGKAMKTHINHVSGTDRVAEVAASKTTEKFIINVQGDEPCLHPSQIEQVIEALENGNNIVSLKKQISAIDAANPNTVKVVTTYNEDALYFSRALIPFQRGQETYYFKHLGIYGFKRNTLIDISRLKPSSLEISEQLEQLRWLENGYKINCATTNLESPSVDTPADIALVEAYLRGDIQ